MENLFGYSAPAVVFFEAGWRWPLSGVEGGLLGQEAGFELLVVEVIVFGSECFGFFAAEHHRDCGGEDCLNRLQYLGVATELDDVIGLGLEGEFCVPGLVVVVA